MLLLEFLYRVPVFHISSMILICCKHSFQVTVILLQLCLWATYNKLYGRIRTYDSESRLVWIAAGYFIRCRFLRALSPKLHPVFAGWQDSNLRTVLEMDWVAVGHPMLTTILVACKQFDFAVRGHLQVTLFSCSVGLLCCKSPIVFYYIWINSIIGWVNATNINSSAVWGVDTLPSTTALPVKKAMLAGL